MALSLCLLDTSLIIASTAIRVVFQQHGPWRQLGLGDADLFHADDGIHRRARGFARRVVCCLHDYPDAASSGPYPVSKFNTMGRSIKVRYEILRFHAACSMLLFPAFFFYVMSPVTTIEWSERRPHAAR